MQLLALIQALIMKANRFAAIVAGACILAMTFVGAVDVIGIFVFNKPLPGAFEFTEILMVAGIFLAMAMAQARQQHVSVGLFLHMLSPAAQRFSMRINSLLTALFFGLLAYVSWKVAAESFRIGEFSAGLIQVPIWPAKLALAIGTSLITLQAGVEVISPSSGGGMSSSDFEADADDSAQGVGADGRGI